MIFTKTGCLYALFRTASPVSGSEICIRANIPAAVARCTLRSNGPFFARMPKNVKSRRAHFSSAAPRGIMRKYHIIIACRPARGGKSRTKEHCICNGSKCPSPPTAMRSTTSARSWPSWAPAAWSWRTRRIFRIFSSTTTSIGTTSTTRSRRSFAACRASSSTSRTMTTAARSLRPSAPASAAS